MKRTFIYNVTDADDGMRIDSYLRLRHNFSSNIIKDLKKTEDGILKNGERAFSIHKLFKGDVLTININEDASKNIVPKKVDFEIVYEDDDIMVINKPPMVPTHPSMDNYDNTLANGIMWYFKEQGVDFTFHAVNRLDKDTSGLMVIAKNAYAHSILSKDLHTDRFVRRYIAIVHGKCDSSGTIDAPIKREDESAIKRCVSEDGQRAITHYKLIESYDKFSLVELELETGRTHQIRVHMSYINHPLAGDFLYGSEDRDIVSRQMLHSSYLEFNHPVTGKRLDFFRELALDMRKCVKNITKDIEK